MAYYVKWFMHMEIHTQTGERKTSFFDKLESISEHFDNVGEENVLQMLNDIVAELEKED